MGNTCRPGTAAAWCTRARRRKIWSATEASGRTIAFAGAARMCANTCGRNFRCMPPPCSPIPFGSTTTCGPQTISPWNTAAFAKLAWRSFARAMGWKFRARRWCGRSTAAKPSGARAGWNSCGRVCGTLPMKWRGPSTRSPRIRPSACRAARTARTPAMATIFSIPPCGKPRASRPNRARAAARITTTIRWRSWKRPCC